MRYVRLIRDVDYPDQVVPKGTIIGVEEDRVCVGLLFIITGELNNRSIHTDHIEDIDLLELLKQYKADEAHAVAAADRHYDEAIQLKRELSGTQAARDRLNENVAQLNRQLEGPWEAKKVPLPREVVEAIEEINSKHKAGFIYDLEGIAREFERNGEPYGIVWRYATHSRAQMVKYFTALVNGYTIEQTPEERLNEGIESIVTQWEKETGCGTYTVFPHLHDRVSDFVKSFYAESTTANG